LDNNIVAEYHSQQEAMRQTNVDSSSIARVCRGERKTAGGFKWIITARVDILNSK